MKKIPTKPRGKVTDKIDNHAELGKTNRPSNIKKPKLVPTDLGPVPKAHHKPLHEFTGFVS